METIAPSPGRVGHPSGAAAAACVDRGWRAADAGLPTVPPPASWMAVASGGEPPAPMPGAAAAAPADPETAAIVDRLENGPGFAVVRRLPVAGRSLDEVRTLFRALCHRLGTPVAQTRQGDVFVDVAHGEGPAAAKVGRWYGSRAELSFHTDRCDLLALLAVRGARSGGVTRIVSSVAIAEEIARTRPDLARVLGEDFSWRVPEVPFPGAPPVFRQPVLAHRDGRFSCCFNRFQIEAGHRFPGQERLSAAQAEALDLFERLAGADGFALSLRLEPGDLQLVNNHIVLHARSSYEDDAAAGRLLLRAWLCSAASRPLHPARAVAFGGCAPGTVRGYYLPGHGTA
ncbi:MAG: TauD/TfdA family dioxygenase [Alphaproteobacteria bacterium]